MLRKRERESFIACLQEVLPGVGSVGRRRLRGGAPWGREEAINIKLYFVYIHTCNIYMGKLVAEYTVDMNQEAYRMALDWWLVARNAKKAIEFI